MDLPESASPEFQATRTESHVFLGYLLAVPTALSAFMLMGQPPTTRFEWVRISWFIILVSALNLPLMLPPFLLIRWLAKDRWLSNPMGAALCGCVMALLYVPLGFALSHAVDIDGAFGPYSTDLKKSLAAGPHFYVPYLIAGASGMLMYWLVSLSGYPAIMANFAGHHLSDARAVSVAGRQIPRHWMARALCLGLLLLLGWGILRWWSPHVISSTAGTSVPKLTLVREIKSTDVLSIAWSPDGSELASKHLNAYAYTVWRSDGRIVSQAPRPPNTFWDIAPAFVDDSHLLVTNYGPNNLAKSFCEIDLPTSSIVEEVEGIQTDRNEFRRNFARTFSRSPNGQFVAVTAGDNQVNALLLYTTKDWGERVLATNFDKDYPTNPPVFSPDGHLLAISTGEKIILMALPSGEIAHSLNFFALSVAFTPDGSVLLASGTDKRLDHTRKASAFRISDGTLIDSRRLPSGAKGLLRWDSAHRLLAYADSDDALHVWDPFGSPGREKIIQFRHTLTDIAFSPDGTKLAVSNGDYVSIVKLAR